MSKVTHQLDELLRGQTWPVSGGRTRRRLLLLLILAGFGMLYGGVMGSFGASGWRLKQAVFAAVKVPLLLTGTFALALPSFFVINTLAGLREDFRYALRALAATQAGLTMVLAALAPFTILWYVSGAHYLGAILFNALMFGVASVSTQRLLRRWYQPLIERHPRQRLMLGLWLGLYGFVGIQMAWILRPFIGNPAQPTHFFRQGVWGNAYETLFTIFWRFLTA